MLLLETNQQPSDQSDLRIQSEKGSCRRRKGQQANQFDMLLYLHLLCFFSFLKNTIVFNHALLCFTFAVFLQMQPNDWSVSLMITGKL